MLERILEVGLYSLALDMAIGGFIFAGHELLYYGGLYLTGLFATATVAICWSGYNIWRYMIR